uniref:Uncharacterized protein n=1 Tax=Phlebotomus papatasi TaxID=29031 RepID=A0A1B0DDG0_PHLPP
MPTECVANPRQRALADAIVRMLPLDEIRILLACGSKVNEPVTQGLRPLHYAVWQKNLPAVNLLLVRGADINATDDCGYSALHLASEHGTHQRRHAGSIASLSVSSIAFVGICPMLQEQLGYVVMLVTQGQTERFITKSRTGKKFISRLTVMLLSYGADPNIKVESEPDSNQTLRPPLAELLASNETTTSEELHLLLRYGAKVCLKTQYRDPDGLLNCLAHVPANSDVFTDLLAAAEEFDPCMIRRSNYLTDDQKSRLLEVATNPVPLKAQCRTFFRRLLGRTLPENVPSLFIPGVLKKYLLYEHSS